MIKILQSEKTNYFNMLDRAIDFKTDKRTFGVWPTKETVYTMLTLIEMGNGNFGIRYLVEYSGLIKGKNSGGPISIKGNENIILNEDPKIDVIVTNYSDSGNHLSMDIRITVDIPALGIEAIFNKTLNGAYENNDGNKIESHKNHQ